mmetsp:Transcript_14412/g.48742  ORF Transcript_14412/g.48742 Transcript_14412/m.48742 type:complete len:252 (-) Transcript_14412:573-1328(-)
MSASADCGSGPPPVSSRCCISRRCWEAASLPDLSRATAKSASSSGRRLGTTMFRPPAAPPPRMASPSRRSDAARHSSRRSLPLKPAVRPARAAGVTSSARRSLASMRRRMSARAADEGRGVRTAKGMRRSTAGSTLRGRFVAPSTTTGAPAWEVRPSHSVRKLACTVMVACSELFSRVPRRKSISSTKTMAGASLRASEKIAEMDLGDSPYHLCWMLASRTLMNTAPASLAIARASMVLPVPGGPWSSTLR